MIERDERPLSDIEFVIPGPCVDSRSREEREFIRDLFRQAGVEIAQDIIDLGCTGLVSRCGLTNAKFTQGRMGGSICGLPCYVPNDRFCLVHNTIGGLQVSGNKDGPQRNPHPEGLALCSRELTDEERGKISGVQAFIAHEGAKEAAEHFGAEFIDEGVLADEIDAVEAEERRSAPQFNPQNMPQLPPFVCCEHIEFNPGCRYCLAQSIVEGPLAPPTKLHVEMKNEHRVEMPDMNNLAHVLESEHTLVAELYVLAARWVRKLVKE